MVGLREAFRILTFKKFADPLGSRRVRCFPLPKPLTWEPGPAGLEGWGGVGGNCVGRTLGASGGPKTGQEGPKRPPG
eukprot:9475728-Pyramimonas_sp.AAC.1